MPPSSMREETIAMNAIPWTQKYNHKSAQAVAQNVNQEMTKWTAAFRNTVSDITVLTHHNPTWEASEPEETESRGKQYQL